MEWGFQHNTSTLTYPQSNGKAEAAVKSMKKLIQAAWTGSQVDEGRLARSLLQYRNTGIICHQLRNYLADQSRTLFQLTIEHLLRNVNGTQKRLTSRLTVSLNMWSSATTDIPFLYRTSILAQMVLGEWRISARKFFAYAMPTPPKPRPVVTEIDPYRRFSVKTASGRVLVRNRRFLRRRVPISPPEYTGPGHPALVRQNPPAHLPRHSTRPHTRPIEEISFK